MLARQASAPTALPDGIFDLPPGKIAAVATYLEMTRPSGAGGSSLPGTVERLAGDMARYRRLYARIGQPWLWFSRAVMSGDALAATLADASVDVWVLVIGGTDVGIAELDFRQAPDCELAFFGLVPEACGRGLGRPLIAEAVRRAFARPIRRLWLHTCTLDHPAAVPLYMRAGFTPFRRAIEIADDPRLSGYLPRDCAPLFPVV